VSKNKGFKCVDISTREKMDQFMVGLS
jgi:hypothetical protein